MIFSRIFLLAAIILLTPLQALAAESTYKWDDFREDFSSGFKVCHNKPVYLEVDLPQSFIDEHDVIELDVKVRSDTYHTNHKSKGNSFELYEPWVRVNDSFWGAYRVPVSEFPASQSHTLAIKKKYFKAGLNKVALSYSWRETSSYCNGNCCGFYLSKASFKDAPIAKYKVAISSDPSGAEIFLDKARQGVTPLTLELSKGFFTLEAKKGGYISELKYLNFPDDSTSQYITLDKISTTEAIPPQITVISPQLINENSSTTGLTTTIRAKITDGSGVDKVFFNEGAVYADRRGYITVKHNLKRGQNPITLKAIDPYGNVAEKSFVINSIKENPSPLPVQQLSPQIAERKLCLILGNAKYPNGGTLKNPVNDARAMSDTLTGLGFDVLLHENTTQKEMKIAIDKFGRKLKDYDVGLFFYAGHGIQVAGTNYLIPVDAALSNINDVEYDCVNVGRVLAKMESAANKTNIIVLDACRDNPFERTWTRGAKSKGLAFMDAPTGSLIAYSTSPGKTAFDGNSKLSLYTSALLEHIATPGLSALQMFQEVRKEVIESSHGNQTPWESTSLTEDFFFGR